MSCEQKTKYDDAYNTTCSNCSCVGEYGRTCVFSEEVHGVTHVCNCCDSCYRKCEEDV